MWYKFSLAKVGPGMKGRRIIKSEQKGHSVQQMKLAGARLETMMSDP